MPVFINNVDDYLGPSQACVNPLFTAPEKSNTQHSPDANLVNGGSDDKISSKNGNGAKTSSVEIADPSSRKAAQSRRRNRQRRVPRIIQSEDSDGVPTPKTKTGGPLRLAIANNVNEKDNNTNTNEGQNNPSSSPSSINNNATTQTIKKKATVTLSDCLSCSGCVTSAEAVLLSHHSIDKLREVVSDSSSRNVIQTKKKRIVFTVSSASLADLYRHLYLEVDVNKNDDVSKNVGGNDETPSRQDFLAMIASFLHSEFDAEMVIDGAFSQGISLVESASEFCYRFRKTQQQSIRGDDDKEAEEGAVTSSHQSIAAMPTVALSSTKTRYINKPNGSDGAVMDEDTLMEVTTLSHPPGRLIKEDAKVDDATMPSSPIQSTALPMLASSCPGFVCLVEKTAPSVVPLLSSAKSPMTIAGTLLKTGHDSLGTQAVTSEHAVGRGVRSSCYHVAIMPCHDKKLEAGRGDFSWERQALLRYGNSSSKNSSSVVNGASKTSHPSGEEDGVKNEKEGTEEDEDLVNEVDLVLTTGELLEVLSDVVITNQKSEGVVASMTPPAHPPPNNASEKEGDDNSSISTLAIRHFLANKCNVVANGSNVLLVTEKNNRFFNDNKTTMMKDMNNLEVDTGVHGSGSYADFIFRYAAQELFGCNKPSLQDDEPLPWKSSSSTYTSASSSATTGKTAAGVIRRRRRRQETTDLREITLYEHGDGSYSCCGDKSNNDDSSPSPRPVLRFATAYGFKNVQLILQSLAKKTGSSSSSYYDYVEIMACPSGCSNGGGQIGANGQRETPRETKERVRKTVSVVPIIRPPNDCGETCSCTTPQPSGGLVLSNSERFGEKARQLFHTRYHVVPKLELSTGATAGVALSDTKW